MLQKSFFLPIFYTIQVFSLLQQNEGNSDDDDDEDDDDDDDELFLWYG